MSCIVPRKVFPLIRLYLLTALLVFSVLFSGSPAWSSAFSIAELGVRAAGMATAFTAVADDGSALVYNPAGIAFQPGLRLEMDNLVVVGLFRFFPSTPPVGTIVPEKGFHGSIRPKFIPVGSMYASMSLSPRLTFGFGAFAPFGLSANFTNFNDGDPAIGKYPGRFAGTRARLESIWFQPTLAYRLTDNMSFAVGGALVYTHLFLEQSFLNPLDDGLEFGREAADDVFPGVDKELAARSIARLLPEGRARTAGTSKSPGIAGGFLYKHPDGLLNIGLMYRSAVTHHIEGKASFAYTRGYTLAPFIGEDVLFKAFPNQAIKGSFTTPASYAFGLATSAFGNMTLAADFHFQDYRRFADVPLNFSITEDMDPDVRTPAEERLVFDFRDSFQIAVGLEKRIGSLAIRGGYLYDRSPVVEKSVGPLFPDSNRHSATVGFSLRSGSKEFSLFYEAMQFVNRTTNAAGNVHQFTNGDYRNFAHLAGMSLRLIFGPQ